MVSIAADRTGTRSAARPLVWRPVQYLGSKLRSLDAIAEAAGEFLGPGDLVVDAFSGTSVVSQRLASTGARVMAVDTSPAAAAWARTLLGIGLPLDVGADAHLAPALRQLTEVAGDEIEIRARPWRKELEQESQFLARRDADGLTAFELRLPQVWRPQGSSQLQQQLFQSWDTATRTGQSVPPGLFSAVFAGTYMGLGQAVSSEALLGAAHHLRCAGEFDAWQCDAILTLLCHALSAAAYSPGKHFAQPHNRSRDKDLSFHAARLLADRNIDVRTVVNAAAMTLSGATRPRREAHIVIQGKVEDLSVNNMRSATCIYADPPYTAQQYSRFYHVLELAVDGRARMLQKSRWDRGHTATSGLYPAGKFLSDFCRSSTAPAALRRVLELSRHSGASLLLSYSGSATGQTGNRRLISMDQILSLVRELYGERNVRIADVSVEYRPFNTAAVSGRDDREYLMVCRAA